MKCTCGYETKNKKSFSNHIRYGCKSKQILANCLYCKKELPKNIKPKDGRKFCNHKCYANWRSENLKGPNAPNYIHGKCNDNLLFRASREYKQWRILVFKRDGYRCVICGDNKGGNLQADHIKDFALYPDLRLDVDNGRTLCKTCHRKTPNYGFKKENSKRNKV
jgi:5-methylcytosine-specific restriction endonuclease McrA